MGWENGTCYFNFLWLRADGRISSKGRPLGFQRTFWSKSQLYYWQVYGWLNRISKIKAINMFGNKHKIWIILDLRNFLLQGLFIYVLFLQMTNKVGKVIFQRAGELNVPVGFMCMKVFLLPFLLLHIYKNYLVKLLPLPVRQF